MQSIRAISLMSALATRNPQEDIASLATLRELSNEH